MMASIMRRFIFAFVLITSTVAAALPLVAGLDSDTAYIDLYKVNWTSRDLLEVPANGTLFNPNPSAFQIERMCIGSNVPSCAFGAEDGTWVAVLSNTNHGCVDISPPMVLNNGFCCMSLDDCALLDRPSLLARAETAISATTLTLTSNEYGTQNMTVRADGNTFSFDATHDQISRICIDHLASGCVFKAIDGTAYAASTLGGNGCVDMESTKLLYQGFCCEDFTSCPGFNNAHSRSSTVDHASDSLQSRRTGGPVVNTILPLMFEGAPDLVGWEYVLTNAIGFNVTSHVPWCVGQICMMNDHAICAFVGLDGTITALVGGWDSNCAVVAPPQILVDGICCASYTQCNASDHTKLAQLVGNATMASYMGTTASSNASTAAVASTTALDARSANVEDITIEYYGASNNYGLQFVTGDYITFLPSVTWGVDQVCIISPQGFCGFWSTDETLGFEVGPVVDGQSSACYTVGGAYVLAGGICCRSSDGCNSARRSTKALSIRDSTASADKPPNREITFSGDPAFYVEAGGVRTSIRIVADGHMEPLPAMGQPVVEVCLDGGICQFYLGGELDLGPSILTGNGGCLGFQQSVTLTGVACN